jgi:single-strand DNA-binding protein
MVSLNKMILIGNLGGEPEMRFTPNGKPVTSFRVATNWRSAGGDGERKEETEWFTVIAWNKLAEQCNQFLGKGRLVYVEGRLRTNTWQGQDGQTRTRNEVIANTVRFLDKQGGSAPAGEGKAVDSDSEELGPDDLPF